MWGMTDASTTKLSGVAVDLVGSIYKSYQAGDIAEKQASETRRAAIANSRLAQKDSLVALKAASSLRKKVERDVGLKYEQIDRLMGAQKSGFASAGVVVSAGSAAHIQSETARLGKIDAGIIFYDGMTEVDRAKDLAKRYTQVSENVLVEGWRSAYLIERAAGTQIGNIMFEGFSKGTKSIYDVGVTEGYWGGTKTKKSKVNPLTQPSAANRYKTYH